MAFKGNKRSLFTTLQLNGGPISLSQINLLRDAGKVFGGFNVQDAALIRSASIFRRANGAQPLKKT